MDTKKPRNSILRVAKDDESTVKDNTVRLKRRISFSGKKYVREFRGEEEPQTWNNSYDVSDHANMSTEDASVATTADVRRQTVFGKAPYGSFANDSSNCAVADKENMYCDKLQNSAMSSQVLPLNNSRLYTTTELIDKSQQQNSSLLIDHTVNVTLLPHERVRFCQLPQPPSISFSMEEYEIQQTKCPVAVERTIDCIVEPQSNRSLNYNQKTIIFGNHDGNLSENWENGPNYSKKAEQGLVQPRRNEPITIFMDESIDKGSPNGKGSEIKSANRRTIQKMEDMEFSLLKNHTNMHDKENMIIADLTCTSVGKTAYISYNMEIESPPRGIPQTSIEAMNVMEAIEMFDSKLKRISFCENSSIVRETIAQDDHVELEMEMSVQSEPMQIRRNDRKTIHFHNDEVHSDRIEVEKPLASLNVSKEPQLVSKRKTIIFNDNDACNQMDISSATAKEATQENIPLPNLHSATQVFSSSTKSKQPSVKVVRKVCAPSTHKPTDVVDLEKQRFERYRKKQAQTKCEELPEQRASTAESKRRSSILDFSLSGSHNGFLSPERSSPLFPPEYVALSNRKLNFRQLNMDIEHGKIQIFPDLPKTPSQSIAKEHIAGGVTEHTLRRRGTLHFGDEMELSANESLCDIRERKPTNQNNYFDFENTQAAAGKKKNKCRYSEADDMLLDSTSFLAQAKLGDETASRNSSKCSTSNRRDTIHFNSEIEVLNETTKVSTTLSAETLQTPPNANITLHQPKDISIAHEPSHNFEVQATEVPQEYFLKTCTEQNHPYTATEDMNISTPNIGEHDKKKSIEERENVIFSDNDACNQMDISSATAKEATQENIPPPILHSATQVFGSSTKSKQPSVKVVRKVFTPSTHKPTAVVDLEKQRFERYRKKQAQAQCEELPDQRASTAEMNCVQKHEPSPPGAPLSQTIHFTDNGNIDIDCDATSNNECSKKNVRRRQTILCHENCELETISLPPKSPKRTLKRKMSLFSKNLESELEDSLTTKLKEALATSRGDRRKTVVFEGDNSMDLDVATTPTDMNEHRERLRRLYEGTPHRSVIEFEDLERALEIELQQAPPIEESSQKEPTKANDIRVDNLAERVPPKVSILRRQTTHESVDIALDVSGLKPLENQDCSPMMMSPVVNLATKKRLTANLTPNLPVPKKRQTLVFNDCDLEESIISKTGQKDSNMVVGKSQAVSKRQTLLFLQNMDIEVLPMAADSDDNLKSSTEFIATLADGVLMPNTCEEPMDETAKETSNVIPDILITNTEGACIPTEVPPLHATQIDSDVGTSRVCTTPNKSRIPVLIGSAKKSNSITSRFMSPKLLDDSNLNHSLETIQIPRRATIAQSRHSNLQIFPVDIEECAEDPKQQPTISAFEHNPITISDVSVYYQAQRQSIMSNDGMKTFQATTLNTPDPIHMQLEDTKVVLSDTTITPATCSDNEIANTSKFKKRYLNLSCNSSIDKTSLNLVETLLDDDDDDLDNEEIENIDEDEVEVFEEYIKKTEPVALFADSVAVNHIRNVSACRKCRRCQETFINETTASTADSFVLPVATGLPVLPPLPGMERLRRLRQRPTLADVNEYYRRKSLERPFNIANLSTDFECEDEEEEEEEDAADLYVANYRKELERFRAGIVEHQLGNPLQVRESFVKRLDGILRENSPSWIFDYQMQYRQILQFHHKQIITSSIVINYEEISPLGEDIEIKCVKLQSCRVPKKNWKPIDFVMDFQLKLELPYDLQSICGGHDEKASFAMLRDIGSVYAAVAELGNNLWRLVCKEQASLISDGNRIFVRKIVRKVITPEHEYPRVQKSEFRVEVTNVRKLCFKDIASPPLHSFREEIQCLPIGLDFLHAFLRNPSTYLKTHK